MTDTSFFNQRIKGFLVICAIILIPSTPTLSQTLKNQCPAGKFCPAGTISPVDCPSGHYCPTGSTEPRECGGGKTCTTKNMTAAQNCTAGSYCPSIPTIQCPEGHYCPPGGASPIVCPPQTWAKAGQTECRAASSYAYADFTYLTSVEGGTSFVRGELRPGVYTVVLVGGNGGSSLNGSFGKGGYLVHSFVITKPHSFFLARGYNGGNATGKAQGSCYNDVIQAGSGGGGGSWVALWEGAPGTFPLPANAKYFVAGGGSGSQYQNCQYPGGGGGGIGGGGGGGANSNIIGTKSGNGGSSGHFAGGAGASASNNWFGQGGQGVTNGLNSSEIFYSGGGGGCGGKVSAAGGSCTGYTLFEGYNFTGPFGGNHLGGLPQGGKISHPKNQIGTMDFSTYAPCVGGCGYLFRLTNA